MRGLGSRLAALALALTIGAAGAHSLGTSSPTGAACSVDSASAPSAPAPHLEVTGLPRTSTGSGWKRAEFGGTGWGPGVDGTCRVRVEAALHPTLARVAGTELLELPARRSGGLLGLAASPANAPPRS
jgi:hypothetical protein